MSMAKTVLGICVPQPCSEAWEEMTPEGQGRFCSSCQKVVIDFSSMSDVELLAALRKPSAGCARFRIDQLDRTILEAPLIPRRSSWIALAATITGLLTGFAKESSGRNHSMMQCESGLRDDEVVEWNGVDETGTELAGQVFEENNEEPVSAVMVELILGEKIIATTYTDFDGKFLFQNLPEAGSLQLLVRVHYLKMVTEKVVIESELQTGIKIIVNSPVNSNHVRRNINEIKVHRMGYYRPLLTSDVTRPLTIPEFEPVQAKPSLLRRLQFWRRLR
jgi:hypothetical protein